MINVNDNSSIKQILQKALNKKENTDEIKSRLMKHFLSEGFRRGDDPRASGQ